jgi:hypothetical protein
MEFFHRIHSQRIAKVLKIVRFGNDVHDVNDPKRLTWR